MKRIKKITPFIISLSLTLGCAPIAVFAQDDVDNDTSSESTNDDSDDINDNSVNNDNINSDDVNDDTITDDTINNDTVNNGLTSCYADKGLPIDSSILSNNANNPIAADNEITVENKVFILGTDGNFISSNEDGGASAETVEAVDELLKSIEITDNFIIYADSVKTGSHLDGNICVNELEGTNGHVEDIKMQNKDSGQTNYSFIGKAEEGTVIDVLDGALVIAGSGLESVQNFNGSQKEYESGVITLDGNKPSGGTNENNTTVVSDGLKIEEAFVETDGFSGPKYTLSSDAEEVIRDAIAPNKEDVEKDGALDHFNEEIQISKNLKEIEEKGAALAEIVEKTD